MVPEQTLLSPRGIYRDFPIEAIQGFLLEYLASRTIVIDRNLHMIHWKELADSGEGGHDEQFAKI